MALFGKKTIVEQKVVYKPVISYGRLGNSDIIEQFKGKELQEKETFPEDIGVKHPFKFEEAEAIYKNVPLVQGAIDKYVDFMVGPGFSVESKDEKAQAIIENFLRDFNFDSVLRQWVKEGLIKGSGFLELAKGENGNIIGMKVLDANNMFIQTDEHGEITGYNQVVISKQLGKTAQEVIPFKTDEIALLTFNKIGDNVYGFGLVSSEFVQVNSLLGLQEDMHTLMKRKANAPLHVKVGDVEKNLMPTEEDIEAIGAQLEVMQSKTEWATDPTWEINVIEFPNFGEKFNMALEHDMINILFGMQVPEVLMGRGNIAEGLAKVQLDAWERNVHSKQAETEKVIENDIFKIVLLANGLDVHVEFVWGKLSTEDKNNNIKLITELLKDPFLNMGLRGGLEIELAKMFNIDPETLEDPNAERERQEEQDQPTVPKPNETKQRLDPERETLANFKGMNLSIREWVGFNYDDYVGKVIIEAKKRRFRLLLGTTPEEIIAGKLTPAQTVKLRGVLVDGFTNQESIRDMAIRINNDVKPASLLKMKDGKIVTKGGRPMVLRTTEQRSISIARTETIRTAALGQIEHYKDGDVQKIRWVTTLSERTCPTCEALNGQIFDINNPTLPPAHVMCRCSTTPVVELK